MLDTAILRKQLTEVIRLISRCDIEIAALSKQLEAAPEKDKRSLEARLKSLDARRETARQGMGRLRERLQTFKALKLSAWEAKKLKERLRSVPRKP